jgi:purine-nucleoside phosphorylase
MVIEARDAILSRALFQPQVAIVLGSGMSSLADQVEHARCIPYREIPHFVQPSADGHSGQLLLGFLSGVKVAVLHGRCHRYEGCTSDQLSFPIFCLRALGADTLVTTNAAGGLNHRYRVGDLMVLDSHIDMLWPRSQAGSHGAWAAELEQRPGWCLRGMGVPYDLKLIEQVSSIARRADTVLHRGCYLATLGPTYETRSEYRMFRWLGADAVGMSTLPEIYAAGRLRMSVLAFSVITNVASTDRPQSTTHEEVLHTGDQAGPGLIHLLRHWLETRAGEPD